MAYTTIDKPTDYFNTVLYTGNGGSSIAVTGVGFQPDWVWLKSRSDTEQHTAWDSVRGGSKRLMPDATNSEFDNSTQGIQSFDSDGFTGGDSDQYNKTSQSVVAWNWLASNTTASNTDGSITSTVSANTTAGFSIVSYTGNGTAGATVGHGLGSTPKIIFVKNRDAAQNWLIYSSALTGTSYLRLNLSNAKGTASAVWNNTDPTSSVFTVGTDGAVNASSQNLIAYCFAEKKGYSKFGSYTGNGSTDGTFVYTGFKPAFVTLKVSSTTGDWQTYDNKRIGYNEANYRLKPSTSEAEVTTSPIDILSNGFKLRASGGSFNGSGNTYIYMAFAENPFVTSTGIPTTAR